MLAVAILSTVVTTHFNRQWQPEGEPLPRKAAFGVATEPLPASKAKELGIPEGSGLVVKEIVPGLTFDRLKLQKGDILSVIRAANAGVTGPASTKSLLDSASKSRKGHQIMVQFFRDGKQMTASGEATEKPRDPGTDMYEVVYSHIVSHGKRMRTIITKPKKPGVYPGWFFIQGFSPISYDFTLSTATGDVKTIDGPLLHQYATEGFVTIRVEKPGVGDSEGGPFAEMDYTTELDIYRQTLKQLKAIPAVDKNNIFIFGHSMGGAFGPMIAAESPVRGIVTYGTAARTWFEYLMDTVRYQGLVGGQTLEGADDEMRQALPLFAQIFLEKKSVEEVKKSHPHLAQMADATFPGGLFNQKSLDFWRQLHETNFPKYWKQANCRVLAVRGESDFVTYDADHKVIADVVNANHPGWGKFEICPSSDHLIHDWPTERASMQGWTKGKFNMNLGNMMLKWIREVMAEK